MEYDLTLLKKQQDDLLNRLNSLSVEAPKMMYNDTYSDIENAAAKLSESDRQDLLQDEKYQQLVGSLNVFIQQEQFRLIRDNLNNNPEAAKVMRCISDYILKFKNDNDNKKADTLKDFEEYIKNYSNMSYADYQKCKNSGSKIELK